MGYRKVSECVGCAECISCSRYGQFQWEFYCDKCDTENVDLYDYEGEQLCQDCAAIVLATKQKGVCDDCEVTDYLYHADSKTVCKYCLQDYLQEIDYEE